MTFCLWVIGDDHVPGGGIEFRRGTSRNLVLPPYTEPSKVELPNPAGMSRGSQDPRKIYIIFIYARHAYHSWSPSHPVIWVFGSKVLRTLKPHQDFTRPILGRTYSPKFKVGRQSDMPFTRDRSAEASYNSATTSLVFLLPR